MNMDDTTHFYDLIEVINFWDILDSMPDSDRYDVYYLFCDMENHIKDKGFSAKEIDDFLCSINSIIDEFVLDTIEHDNEDENFVCNKLTCACKGNYSIGFQYNDGLEMYHGYAESESDFDKRVNDWHTLKEEVGAKADVFAKNNSKDNENYYILYDEYHKNNPLPLFPVRIGEVFLSNMVEN